MGTGQIGTMSLNLFLIPIFKTVLKKKIIAANTVTGCLMVGTGSETCTVRRFHHSTNITEYTSINLDGTAYYTPRLHGTASCFLATNL